MAAGQTGYSQDSHPSRADSNGDSHNRTIHFQDVRHLSKVSGRSTVSPFIPQHNALLSPSPAREQSLDSTRLPKNSQYAKFENDYSISEVSGQREEDHATPQAHHPRGGKPHQVGNANQDIADVHPSLHGGGGPTKQKYQAQAKPVFKSNEFLLQQQAGAWRQHGYPDYPGHPQAYGQRQFEAMPNYPQPGASYQAESTTQSLKQGHPEYGYLQALAQAAPGESQNSMFSYGSYQLPPQLPPQYQPQAVSQSMQMPAGYNAYLRALANEEVERVEKQPRVRGAGAPSKQPRQKGPVVNQIVSGLPTNLVHRRNRAEPAARSLNAEQMRRRARQMSQRHHNLTVQPRAHQANHSATGRGQDERDLFLPSIVSQPGPAQRAFSTIDDETAFIKNFLVKNGKGRNHNTQRSNDHESPARLPKGIYKGQKSTKLSQYHTAASQPHAPVGPPDSSLRSQYDQYMPPPYGQFQMVPNLHLNASPHDLQQYRANNQPSPGQYSPASGSNVPSQREQRYKEQTKKRK